MEESLTLKLSFLLFFLKIGSSTIFIKNSFSSIQGNGTLNFPFSSFDYAFGLFGTSADDFYLFSSVTFIKNYNFTSNTSIVGSDEDGIQLQISEMIFLEGNLTISNLTVCTNLSQNLIQPSNAFLVYPYGNLVFINCKITKILGSQTNFIPFKISSFSNLTLSNVSIFEIYNSNIFSLMDSGKFSFITITNSNFFNINIDSTQLLTSNMSILVVISKI